MSEFTVHVVDDDASVLEALALLMRLEGFAVRTYSSGRDFLAATLEGAGCVVLDMRLGDMHGLAVLAALKRRGNGMPVIVLTAYGDIPTTVQAMREGARDFLTKSEPPPSLVARIRAIRAEQRPHAPAHEADGVAPKLERLSPRETEVLALAAHGLDNRAIAERLALSVRTVEAHRTRIAHKLEVKSLAALFRQSAIELKRRLT